MYVNNIEPEMFLPPGSESFNHNATRTTSSRSRSNNVNNNIVPVYKKPHYSMVSRKILSPQRCFNELDLYLILFLQMCMPGQQPSSTDGATVDTGNGHGPHSICQLVQ